MNNRQHVGLQREKTTTVEQEIIRRIRESGPMTFADFMETALYSHTGGYYTSSEGRWGPKGDYITSIDVSPVFAELLAGQVFEMWELCGSPGSFELIEAGAGRGWLSKGILSTLKESYRSLYDVINIRLIEKNNLLHEVSVERVYWHQDLSEIKPSQSACVLSNELIDSFPVHRVRCSHGRLWEVYVNYVDGRFVEVLKPLSTDELEAYVKNAGIEPVEGMLMEINLNALRWLETVSGFLQKGFVITIDYGMPSIDLYAPERRGGSLVCHFRHTVNYNPYVSVGLQDMTTHVDFTTFKNKGRSLGLELSGYTTQKNFLIGLGIIERLKIAGAADQPVDDLEKIKYNRTVAQLINPGGMGDTFKVMIQHKGIDRPSLRGFSFKDMSKRL